MLPSQTAPRLADSRGVTGVSFDVFDTCVVRRVGVQSDLFRVLGETLAKKAGIVFNEEFSQQFVESRCEAARRALRRASREEATLQEIWQQLGKLYGREIIAGVDGPALELETETACLAPIEETRERIARERAAGRKILFISDTHHPGPFIENWLRSHGFAAENDPIYVSAEEGRTKRSGTLFRHVLEKEGLQPAELLHIGSDPVSDGQVPDKLGIRTELFTRSRLDAVERLLLEKRPPAGQLWISTSAELKCQRLAQSEVAAAKSAPENFVAQFLGPFCCAFGHWVLNKAAADGVGRLYFASRDARLLWPVCQILARARNLPIDLRYLMVSRQALRLPVISQLTPVDVQWVRESGAPATLSRLLGNFELQYEYGAGEWLRLRPDWHREAALKTPLDWALFWRFLNSPKIRARILEVTAERRRNAKDYLVSQGMMDPVPAGFVDLGWFLGCQYGLNLLRTQMGSSALAKGYYLGLRRSCLGPAEVGPTAAVFYEAPEDSIASRHQAWLRRSYLLEQIVGIADHPSVRGYGSNGAVEFVAESAPPDPNLFRSVEKALLDYAASFGDCWRAMAQDESHLPHFLGTLLRRFFDAPSSASVETLQAISFSFEQGTPDSERLIAPYSWRDAVKACLPSPAARRSRVPRHWPEASLQATPQAIRQILQWSRLHSPQSKNPKLSTP